MALEPVAGQTRHLVERSPLFDHMRTRHDAKLLYTVEARECLAVQLSDLDVVSSQTSCSGARRRRRHNAYSGRPSRETTAPIISGREAASSTRIDANQGRTDLFARNAYWPGSRQRLLRLLALRRFACRNERPIPFA